MSNEIALRQQSALSGYAPEAIQTTMTMAKMLVASRLTPRGIDTPEKAFYVIMKGRELGVPPIRALERIHIIEGKCCMAAELMLERFRQRGGRCKWPASDAKKATIWLKAPNGDEHEETFTWDDAITAGVTNKDNWRKWPKFMLRARAISGGLRALGEAEGMYDPDELGAVTNQDGEVVELPKAPLAASTPPPVTSVEYSGPSAVSATDDDEVTGETVDVYDAKTGELVGQRDKASRAQIAKLHVLFKELAVPDEDITEVQRDGTVKVKSPGRRTRMKLRYGKDSTALLSREEASDLIDRLESSKARFGTMDERQAKKQKRGAAVLAELAQEFSPEELAAMNEPAGDAP